jgi:hypothetical protein
MAESIYPFQVRAAQRLHPVSDGQLMKLDSATTAWATVFVSPAPKLN